MLLGRSQRRQQQPGDDISSAGDLEPAPQPAPPQRQPQEGLPPPQQSPAVPLPEDITLADAPEEILLRVGSNLRARDLGRLAGVSRRLRLHAEEAARRRMAACTAQELAWVPGPQQTAQSIRCLDEVEALRAPPTFVRAHASMVISPEGTEVLQDPKRRSAQAARSWSSSARAAACGAAMRAGRHYAQFTMLRGMDLMVGVVRTSWPVEGPGFAHDAEGHCFFWTANGKKHPGNASFDGAEPARQGDRIGTDKNSDFILSSVQICAALHVARWLNLNRKSAMLGRAAARSGLAVRDCLQE